MKVTYDTKAKALYIKVADAPDSFGIIHRTEELVADTVLIDYLASGEVYGISISPIDKVEHT